MKRFSIIAIMTIILFIFASFIAYYIRPDWLLKSSYGDFYNGLSALFTVLAFFGLIYTINLQSRELQLQRQELTETREILNQQKEEMVLTRRIELKRRHQEILEMSIFNDELSEVWYFLYFEQ